MYPTDLWLFAIRMILISLYDIPKSFLINGWSSSLHVGLSWLWAPPQLWLSWTLRLTCPTPTANQQLPVSCHGSPEHTRGDTFAYHQLTCSIQLKNIYSHFSLKNQKTNLKIFFPWISDNVLNMLRHLYHGLIFVNIHKKYSKVWSIFLLKCINL